MKNKFFIFSSILIFVGILFCISSCQDINNPKQINLYINLDLSNLPDIQSSQEYILKVLAYNAYSYENGSEIENLPLIAETESKFDQNGNVNVSFEVEIGCKIILVAKLYQIIGGKESITPLYVGNSDVIKIKTSENKVHIILKKQQNDINNTTVNDNHQHTYSDEWCMSITHHWKWASCGHDVIGEISTHNFSDWQTTKISNCRENGKRKATCTVCDYEKTEIILAEHKYTNGVCVHCGMREMVLIPAGKFLMGSNEGQENNKPVHEVTITKPFYMGKYEVTQGEFEKYCDYRPPHSDYIVKPALGYGDNFPVYYVYWIQAIEYCNKRSIAEGLIPCYSVKGKSNPDKWGIDDMIKSAYVVNFICNWEANGYRLPTEAEWEYAARAGDNTVDSLTYSGTSDINYLDQYAWYNDNSSAKTHEVGKKQPNAFGLYDMSGNVKEMCWNFYIDSENEYDEATEGGTDPTGPSSGTTRVVRGGSYKQSNTYLYVTRRTYLEGGLSTQPQSDGCVDDVGFRVVRSAVVE